MAALACRTTRKLPANLLCWRLGLNGIKNNQTHRFFTLTPNIVSRLCIADLIEQRFQKPSVMNYGDDEDFALLDPADNPIAVNNVLANLLIIKLGNDASGARERFRLAGSI